jgi:hypothetical protein
LDEYENGIIDNYTYTASGIIDTFAFSGPIQADEIVSFDVTPALEHDLFTPLQTDFSGFILTSNGYYALSFYNHVIPVNSPKLTIYSNETIINISTFTATPKAGKVILNWSTASEIDNAGFNLYRAETEDGEYIKINDSLIPAQGSSTQGASYEFIDNDVKNRKTYYYKLEDIDLNGTSTMHGSVSATPRWFLGIFGIFKK